MLETQNKSDTPNFEPLRVKQQVIICSSSPTLCLASWIETQVFLNPIGLRPPMGRKLVMVLSFRERLKAKMCGGGGSGNNLAVLSHICSGLADVSQYLYMARFYCTIITGEGLVGLKSSAYTRQNQLLHKIRQ